MSSFPRLVIAWRIWHAALVAIVTWGFITPMNVAASCGDYLHHWRSDSDFHVTPDLQQKPVIDPDQKKEPRPCSGPFCSHSPSTPLVPTTPPTLRVEQNWSCPSIVSTSVPTGWSRFLADKVLFL